LRLLWELRSSDVKVRELKAREARGMGATAIAKVLGIGRATVYKSLNGLQ
jgi:predicted transcriptional regulator